ncbi:MAG: PAS domain-containing protein, partial [Pseudomonas sp.]|nr:PAS domain-containing protein [Pseudomonas sp.]
MVTLGSDSARGHILKDKTRGQAVTPPLIKDSVVTDSSLSAEQEMHERYRLIAKATNDAVWDWDLVSNHVLWNDVLTRSYGYRSEDIVPTGEWWLARIHPDDRARVESS